MPHDPAIIEAIKKHRRGQGAVTCIGEPSVGGGESPDVLSWFPPETGPYWTLLDEYKDSRSDLRADHDKPHRQRAGCGDCRTLIVREGVASGPEDPVLAPWLVEGWGVECLREDGSIDLWRTARYRVTKDKRTEDRLLHDHIRKLELRLKELEGGGQRRNGRIIGGLTPNDIEHIRHMLADSAELELGEVAKRLHERDPKRISIPKAADMIRTALVHGLDGIVSFDSGQDKYLALRETPQEA